MKKVWILLFGLVSIAELGSVTFNYSIGHSIAKPLIMPLLMGYFISATSTRPRYFLGALIFCWLGDVLLMFQGTELFFILGLVAFLIGHLCYMISYRMLRFRHPEGGLLNTQKISYSLPFLLAGTGLVTILIPHLGDLKIPVMIYALVLTLMVLQALFRYGHTSGKSFGLILTGAIFFMASDSMLAINKFMQPLPFASLLIMTTYIIAQYFIVEGAIKHYQTER